MHLSLANSGNYVEKDLKWPDDATFENAENAATSEDSETDFKSEFHISVCFLHAIICRGSGDYVGKESHVPKEGSYVRKR